MNGKKLVIFDFDGVIADSFEAVYTISQLESPEITREQYIAKFEGNINQTHPITQGKKTFDFFSHWEPVVNQQTVFNHMPQAISKIAKQYDLAIVSSTTTEPIRKFLNAHKLQSYFDHILGNDVDHSKIVKINMLLEKTKAEPTATIMITDTLGDLYEARATGIYTIAVTWGFHPKSTLFKGNPTAIVNKPEQLPEKVKNILGT